LNISVNLYSEGVPRRYFSNQWELRYIVYRKRLEYSKRKQLKSSKVKEEKRSYSLSTFKVF